MHQTVPTLVQVFGCLCRDLEHGIALHRQLGIAITQALELALAVHFFRNWPHAADISLDKGLKSTLECRLKQAVSHDERANQQEMVRP